MIDAEDWPFFVGLGLVPVLWLSWWRHTRWARFITTIEHESLHAIVAMLTGIPVRELKVREDGSGHVLFEPPGHWLLYLAPYFVPLLLMMEIGVVRLLRLPPVAEAGLLGVLLGLSLLGHLRQIHPRQTDFRHAGRLFTAVFLPTAFLLAYASAMMFLRGHAPGAMVDLAVDWFQGGLEDVELAVSVVSGWIRG